jgi:DNA polymerase V
VTRDLPVALVDVRSMYVSVERVLDASLTDLPVIVLSNNDGCAVSRSDEAKQLGIAMGQPWFEIREQPRFDTVRALSSNYAEYGGFSSRFHSTVAAMALDSEVYSIDEAFLTLPPRDPADTAAAIQERVLRWTGLPTSAGIGTTKTLAKVAQRHAKAQGAILSDISDWATAEIDELLAATPTEDVWGIGGRLREGLAGIGVRTALDLARADPRMLRRRWSVVLERTARELAGYPCLPVGHEPGPRHRQQLMYSRMLGATVSTTSEMREVLTQYASQVSRRLRSHQLEAGLMQVWISTSHYRPPAEHHSVSVPLDPPTADPIALIRASHTILPKMRSGSPYNRAGILLTALLPAGANPPLWNTADPALARLTTAVDKVWARYGRQVLGHGSAGLRTPRRWEMRRELLSPAGTTRWEELLTVR